jgi:hypothetical protein
LRSLMRSEKGLDHWRARRLGATIQITRSDR